MRRRTYSASVYLMLGVTSFLLLAGLLAIYSASSVNDYVKLGDSAHHLKRQLLFITLGILALVAFSRVDLRFGARRGRLLRDPELIGWVVWAASMVGLVVVPFVGVRINGAKRWIDAGIFNIQPSEFAKLGCVILVAVLLTRWKGGSLTGKDTLGRVALVMLPVLVLVMLQPDMGTTMSIAIAVFVVLILGDVRASALWGMAGAGGGLVAIFIATSPYRLERYLSFLDPWKDPRGDGFQIIQSLYAFGSGGLTGVGLGMSRQKFFYLPAAHTDFIFAIIGEELGLIGTLSIVLAFVLMMYAGTRIALEAGNRFDRLLAGGLTAMIVIQAAMNIAAVTGSMPVTGIPLPLVSYGGSSMIFTLACVGLVLGVARRSSGSQARGRAGGPAPASAVAMDARTRDRGDSIAGEAWRRTGQRTRGSERAVSSERRRDSGPRASGTDSRRPARRRGA